MKIYLLDLKRTKHFHMFLLLYLFVRLKCFLPCQIFYWQILNISHLILVYSDKLFSWELRFLLVHVIFGDQLTYLPQSNLLLYLI
jgi:hypothetical protein